MLITQRCGASTQLVLSGTDPSLMLLTSVILDHTDYRLKIGPTKGAPGRSHLGSVGRKTGTIFSRSKCLLTNSSEIRKKHVIHLALPILSKQRQFKVRLAILTHLRPTIFHTLIHKVCHLKRRLLSHKLVKHCRIILESSACLATATKLGKTEHCHMSNLIFSYAGHPNKKHHASVMSRQNVT
jgi:hypothetical protein